MTRERLVLGIATDDPVGASRLLERARSRGFRQFVLRDSADLSGLPGEEVYRENHGSLSPTGSAGASAIPIVSVGTPEELARALHDGERSGRVAIRWTGDRIIPLENAIAQRTAPVELWVVTDRVEDVSAALGALEQGADRVVIDVDEAGKLDLIEAQLELVQSPENSWELVRVTRSEPAGIGDRVLVDTTSILAPSEGLLVGSVAGFLFLVTSEAEGSAFTRPRPFRVNASTAHAYVMLADGTTRYLSELVPGDAVLVGDPEGEFRAVRVGRLKTERRPVRLVTAERAGRPYTIFLQDAETVRLSAEHGRIPSTRLATGDRVFGIAFPPARHLGTTVPESIDER